MFTTEGQRHFLIFFLILTLSSSVFPSSHLVTIVLLFLTAVLQSDFRIEIFEGKPVTIIVLMFI